MPALFVATDEASAEGQRKAFRITRWLLVSLVVAALGGSLDLRVGEVDLGGLLSTAGFVGALLLGLQVQASKPDVQWYQGRAAAESVKTLVYRYAVGGDPFGASSDDADSLLLSRFKAVMAELPVLAPATGREGQITTEMRRIRSLDLAQRKAFYLSDRIDDQADWYMKRSTSHRSRARRLGALAGVISGIGVVAGLMRAFGALDPDILGMLAAAAAAIRAWTDMHQDMTNATAYALAVQELALARTQALLVVSEAEWCRFVSDTEDAISREHTMWLARKSRVPH